MTVSQKVRLLANIYATSDKDIEALGVPSIKYSDIREGVGGVYPSPAALAHSWDTDLMHSVASDSAKMLARSGTNLVRIPGAKIKLSPYKRETTEDPYLASRIAESYAKGVRDVGLGSVMRSFRINGEDSDWMDKKPSERVIYEYIVKPYADAVKNSKCNALMSDNIIPREGYEQVNADLRASVLNSNLFERPGAVICEHLSDEDTVSFIMKGGICVKGSAAALEGAVSRYRKMSKGIEVGEFTPYDLEKEQKAGRAVSPEEIDVAADRLLSFIYSCNETQKGKQLAPNERNALALKAAEESVVLLKNKDSALPIVKKEMIAMIGGMAFGFERNGKALVERCHDQLSVRGFKRIMRAHGYDMEKERGEEGFEKAVSIAEKADTVILFLGIGKGRYHDAEFNHRLTLPANQLALIERLKPLRHKVIAVIESGYSVDVSPLMPFQGIMVAPLGVRGDARSLVNVITGHSNPSGKLAYSLYSHTDTVLGKQLVYKDEWRMKSGPFIGYRYYDTAGVPIAFPFGFGLSYTSFSYSALTVKGNTVSFNVTNDGKLAGTDVPQVYMGNRFSNVLRPTKELVGFARVSLNPGETKRVSIDVNVPAVYDAKHGEFVKESGEWTVYVGSSSLKANLTCDTQMGNTTLESDGESLVDYLQSKSNILTDKYTLEADYKPMRKTVKNIVCGILSLVMAVALFIYNAENSSATFITVLSAILAAGSVFFFVVDRFERKKDYADKRKEIDEVNEKHFEDATQLPEFSTDEMFKEEFDEVKHSISPEAQKIEEEENYQLYVNKDLDFAVASAEFEAFATQHGVKLERGVAQKIFASIAASRLVIFNGVDSFSFRSLILALCEYFDSYAYIDNVDSTYTDENRILFMSDAYGNRMKTNVAAAIDVARDIKYNVHIASLDNVKCETLLKAFSPFVKYVKNPLGTAAISTKNERDEKSVFLVPHNLWFMLNLAVGEGVDQIPASMTEVASIITGGISVCDPTDDFVAITKFNYYQVDYICERILSKFGINENWWKKIDKMESFAAEFSPFRFENKQCLSIERFASVLMSCDIDEIDAVDETIAAKVIPAVLSTVGKGEREDAPGLVETFDSVFGEDGMNESRGVIKHTFAVMEERERLAIEAANAPAEPEVEEVAEEEAEEERVIDENEDFEEEYLESESEVGENAPATESEVVEESVTEEAVVEESVTEEAVAEEAVVEEAETATEEPVAEETSEAEEVAEDTEPAAEETATEDEAQENSENDA